METIHDSKFWNSKGDRCNGPQKQPALQVQTVQTIPLIFWLAPPVTSSETSLPARMRSPRDNICVNGESEKQEERRRVRSPYKDVGKKAHLPMTDSELRIPTLSQRRTSLFRSPCDLGLLAPYDLSEASSAKFLPSMQVSWNVR